LLHETTYTCQLNRQQSQINLLFPWILIVGDYATTINLESAKAQINGQFDISLDLSPKTPNIGDESKADISARWAKGMV
jgi:hypothetical protein